MENGIGYIETPMASPLAAAPCFLNSLAIPVMFHDELGTLPVGNAPPEIEHAASCSAGLGARADQEAPSPRQPTPRSESPVPGPAALAGSALRVTVKNTFIDVSAEDEPLEMQHTRSCVARLSTPQPGRCPSPRKQAARAGAGSKSADVEASIGSQMHGTVAADGQPGCQPCAWFRKPSGCSKGVACKYCHLCPCGEVKKRRKQKLDRIRRGLPPFSVRRPGACVGSDVSTTDEDGNSIAADVKESSIDYIETPMAWPLAAASFYADSSTDPMMFHDEFGTVPAGNASSQGDSAALFNVGMDAHVEREAPPPPRSAPRSASPVPELALLDQSTLKVHVRNTFIDVSTDDDEPLEVQHTKSCMARFSPHQPGRRAIPRTPTAAGAGAGAGAREAPPCPDGGQASIGSQMHGTVAADGQPGCTPCAWFRKPSGCSKGAACKYCHLCPFGEVKKRRRQKLERIRRAAAVVAPRRHEMR